VSRSGAEKYLVSLSAIIRVSGLLTLQFLPRNVELYLPHPVQRSLYKQKREQIIFTYKSISEEPQLSDESNMLAVHSRGLLGSISTC
jgi:hypothetical protein